MFKIKNIIPLLYLMVLCSNAGPFQNCNVSPYVIGDIDCREYIYVNENLSSPLSPHKPNEGNGSSAGTIENTHQPDIKEHTFIGPKSNHPIVKKQITQPEDKKDPKIVKNNGYEGIDIGNLFAEADQQPEVNIPLAANNLQPINEDDGIFDIENLFAEPEQQPVNNNIPPVNHNPQQQPENNGYEGIYGLGDIFENPENVVPPIIIVPQQPVPPVDNNPQQLPNIAGLEAIEIQNAINNGVPIALLKQLGNLRSGQNTIITNASNAIIKPKQGIGGGLTNEQNTANIANQTKINNANKHAGQITQLINLLGEFKISNPQTLTDIQGGFNQAGNKGGIGYTATAITTIQELQKAAKKKKAIEDYKNLINDKKLTRFENANNLNQKAAKDSAINEATNLATNCGVDNVQTVKNAKKSLTNSDKIKEYIKAVHDAIMSK